MMTSKYYFHVTNIKLNKKKGFGARQASLRRVPQSEAGRGPSPGAFNNTGRFWIVYKNIGTIKGVVTELLRVYMSLYKTSSIGTLNPPPLFPPPFLPSLYEKRETSKEMLNG